MQIFTFKEKNFKFWTENALFENALFGYFYTITLKKTLPRLELAPSNLSKYSVSCKTKNL